MIADKVREWTERHALLPVGGRVVAACSGGADSLALVDLLQILCQEKDCRLFVAHVDHCLRGAAAEADAAFTAEFCAERKVSFFAGKVDVPAHRQLQGGSLESAARDCRYRFLRQVAAEVGGALIATGHHKDDQAETVLLHLLRGSGSRGMGAMRPRQGDIIRPLLCVSRAEIEAYCTAKELRPREDETNRMRDFRRNRLRHDIMPRLHEYFNPALTETLCRTAEILSVESDYLQEQVTATWNHAVTPIPGGFLLRVDVWRNLHKALQRRLLLTVLARLRGDARGLGFHHVDIVRELLLAGEPGKNLDLPEGIGVSTGYGTAEFFLEKLELTHGNPLPASQFLVCPGSTSAPPWRTEFRISLHQGRPDCFDDCDGRRVAMDYGQILTPFFVRSRLPGDRLHPLGAQGSRKLKEMLIDMKIPRSERDRIPLVCDSGGILWVVGCRQAERTRITEHTNRYIIMEANRQEE